MIEGFKLFHAVHPNSTLTIAGDGPEKNHLSELIRTHHLEKHVTLLGTVEPISDILHQHDCLISSTLSEGFSGALVEAAFAKLPILATKIPPNEEIVTHLDSGYLFEPRSAEAIANAMVWFKENRK